MNLLTAAIAAAVAVIAFMQWRTAKQKVVLDLFGRRIETYSALRDVVSKVRADSNAATLKNSFKFLQALDRAGFLFGSEVIEHLEKIDHAINEVRISVTERKDLSPGPELEANVAKERTARETIGSFYTTLQPLFSRYMRMDQKLPHTPWD
jgi:hypothetical protein